MDITSFVDESFLDYLLSTFTMTHPDHQPKHISQIRQLISLLY